MKPNIAEAKRFADEIHAKFPAKWPAYDCSPSFDRKLTLAQADIETFRQELVAMG